MYNWDNALVAAELAAIAYMDEKPAIAAAKKLGFTSVNLVANDGAEMLVCKSAKELWFAFRGTEPAKLNDVLADLKLIKHTAMAGGKVHGGFKKEVDDLWMYVVKDVEDNRQIKKPREINLCGHSLGAAMATIAATRLNEDVKALYTFGSPRVGGPLFIKNIKCPHMRFQNNNDIVTRMPPAFLGFRHHGDMIYFNKDGVVTEGPTMEDFFLGVLNSWKRWKFFDGVVDHGIPHYIRSIKSKIKLSQ